MNKLWNQDVGYLDGDKKAKVAVFEFKNSFLKSGLDISPIAMSINAPRSLKHLLWPGNRDKLYQNLPTAIADSLPDKWGDSIYRAWLIDNKISTKKITPVDHLLFIGSSAMGALEFEPAQLMVNNEPSILDIPRLYQFSSLVFKQKTPTIVDNNQSILWQDLIKISSSPGGKRPKAIVAVNKNTGEVISGQGRIPNDFQHYILKYDDNSTYPLAKLEFVYYKMALKAGIHMMPSELRQYGDVPHFLTQRFDRKGNQKIHTQTLAAMAPPVKTYEGIFEVIRYLNLPIEDSIQQYLRTVFNIITRNVDDHNKNFSFCMTEKAIWRLSPAYDLTFSVDLGAPGYVNRHQLTVNEKDEDINRKDLEKLGIENDIPEYKALINQVIEAANLFPTYAKELGIQNDLIASIQSEFIML
ncbi:type II toxin-antitoxin system HipA family toxin [Arachidicoccus rhizosphaerae]|nr:type II toxin-antitoxin system HipA family toxin [Arachidicoccus rhizosphaerae]